MEVPREDMELIRDALNAAENNLGYGRLNLDIIKLVQRARKRTEWLVAEAPDPVTEPGSPEIMRGWLRERPDICSVCSSPGHHAMDCPFS
jgi:hypothetical protein